MRVTLDVDHNSEWKRLAQYFNMKYVTGIDEIRVSASGEPNLHLIKRGLQISYENSLGVRAALGECPTRLRFDGENNMKPKQILWSEKIIKGKRLHARVITERDLLALPFFSKIHGGWYRCGRQSLG